MDGINETFINCSMVESNVTSNPEDDEFERLVRYIVPTIFGVIVAIGFVGNLLVIIVVCSNKQMQNTTNILILSLAVADLLFIVFCVPFTAASYAMPIWPFGNIWCKINNYLMYACAYASVYTLVLMSLDRYLAVVHPIASINFRNQRNAIIMVYLTWIIILAGNVPILFQWLVITYCYKGESRSACINPLHDPSVDQTDRRIFFGSFFAFGYLIPLALVCFLYGFMLKRLLYGVVPGGSQRARNIKSKKRVTRMVVIVVAIFALCWLPIQILFMIQSFGTFDQSAVSAGFQMASNCLAYMNSCVNPILYAFLSENFRRSFMRLLCCQRNGGSRLDYEKTNVRADTAKEMLLNNTATTVCPNGSKDKNCNNDTVVNTPNTISTSI